MNKILKDNNHYIITIFSVIMLIIIVTGVTYALFEASSSKNNFASGDTCFSVKYTKGQDISGELSMGSNYASGSSTDIVISIDNNSSTNKCNNIIGQGTIYLTTNKSNLNFTKTNVPLKYSVVVGSTVKATGSVDGSENQILYENFDVTTTSVTYKVYLWYDASLDDTNDFENISYQGFIHASVYGKSTIKS